MLKNQSKAPFFLLCCMIAVSALVVSSCIIKGKKDDKILAKVGDKYLYFSDIKDIFPKDCSKEDSLALSKGFIDSWIKTRLLLKKAELNLSSDELNVNEEIETYRTSLLVYKYEARMLQEKLDTLIHDYEIQRYYEANIANFSAEEYVVRALYIKLPKDAPTLWNVRRLYVSVRENDIQELTDYCRRYAVDYDFFDDEWIRWSLIESELPQNELATRNMRYSNSIEQQDDDYIYLVHIREKRAPGDAEPLMFVRDKVKSIIINQRKLKFISELQRDIYNDALSRRQFEIFNIN